MSFTGTVVINAGPRVNLVEGPNGSGKSSLVTAVCVGLAGAMKNLGRQKQPVELIRYGAPAFEVEITLSGGPGAQDIVVLRRTESNAGGGRGRKRRRTGHKDGAAPGGGSDEDGDEDEAEGADADGTRSGAHTEWRINGRVVAEARVKELTREMTIHFDNLCQFLPQERVSAFAALDPMQLLESTEETIGNGELLQQHKQLIGLSAQLKSKHEELQRVKDRLARVEAEQDANRPDYDRLQRRNVLRQQARMLQLKLVWLAKECAAQQVEAARSAEEAEQRKLVIARQRLAEVEAPYNERTRAIQTTQQAAQRLVREAREKDGGVNTALTGLRRIEDDCRSTEQDLGELEEKARQWETDVARCRQDLQHARDERQRLPTALSPEKIQRLAAIDAELRQQADEASTVDWEVQENRTKIAAVNEQIRGLEAAERRRMDRREQRLRKLEEVQPGSRELFEWINATREAGGFRRRVFGPLLMEMSPIADRYWAACAEDVLTNRNLAAVVTEDYDDNKLVDNWRRSKQAAAPLPRPGAKRAFDNTIMYKPGPHGALQYPHGSAGDYTQYGITHTVDELFEVTSDLVKVGLVESSRINTVFVGTSATDRPEVMEALLRDTAVTKIFTPGKSTTVSTSMYDRTHVTKTVRDLKQARLLADDVMAGDEQAEQQQLEELRRARGALQIEASQLQARLQALEAAARALQDERRRLNDEHKAIADRLGKSSRRITELERRLQRLSQQGNPKQAAAALRDTLRSNAELLVQKAKALLAAFEAQHKLHRKLAAAELSAATAAAGLAPLQLAVRRVQDTVRAAEASLAAARQVKAAAQGRLQEAELRVSEEVGPRGPNGEMRAAWQQWPDEVGLLEQLLADKQAEMEQAQAALRGDERALLEAWQRREVEMRELRQGAAAGTGEVDALSADIQARKGTWLPTLKRHMDEVNQSLQGHFTAIGCEGCVILRESGEEFAKYAAEIRVRYRPNEPLRALDRNHHSGGERSVATMLYLMALQGVTTTPFRIVDEINQGMDSRNERKVFNQLVECSSRPDTPQCFLLTPKLIRNLRYNEHVRVQSIKVGAAGSMSIQPECLGRVVAEAEQGEDAGAAGAGRNPQQLQQLGQGPGLGVIPWPLRGLKRTLLFSKTAEAARS